MRRINWPQAIAEVFLLAIGVTLALAADAWNDARLERREEASYLEALQRDFAATRTNLQSVLDYTTRVRDNNMSFIEALSSPPGSIAEDSLLAFAEIAFMVEFYEPVLGTYRDMVNSGKLELLRSDSLRLELAQFEIEFEGVQLVVEESWNQWNDLQVPYMVKNLDVGHFHGGEYRGVSLPPPAHRPRLEAYWSQEFVNILTVSVISKIDMIESGKALLARTNSILRLIAEARDREGAAP